VRQSESSREFKGSIQPLNANSILNHGPWASSLTTFKPNIIFLLFYRNLLLFLNNNNAPVNLFSVFMYFMYDRKAVSAFSFIYLFNIQ